MRHSTNCLVLYALIVIGCQANAQQTTAGATAVCNFDTAKQVAVQYQRVVFKTKKRVLGKEVAYDKVWAPGGKPMTMFTNTSVVIGSTELSPGAYTLFALPEEKKWTLIISKSSDTSGTYDPGSDLARVPMEFGRLPKAVGDFTVYFGHIAPDRCSMRLDVGNVRAWVDVIEKK